MMTNHTDVRSSLADGLPWARYTSGLTLYEESLVDSRWVGRNWSPIGRIDQPMPIGGELILDSAFRLEIDGESLHRGWEFVEAQEAPAERAGQRHMVVSLRHGWRPVEVAVHTVVDGSPVLTRWLEITNTADRPAALTGVSVWSGRLHPTQVGSSYYGGYATAHGPYDLGYFVDDRHSTEGHFQWLTLGRETVETAGRTGKSGWGHPIAYVRDNAAGRICVLQLAWSGNWTMRFESRAGVLFAQVGPTAPGPMRVMAPGETVSAPPVHVGCTCGGLTEMVQGLHEHQRRSVLITPPEGCACLVSYNHWGYTTHELSEERLLAEIDVAVDVGAEVFTVDAGWYGDKGVPWPQQTGRWRPGDRLPNGLAPVYDYAHSKGLKCGLWVWIEAAKNDSEIIARHPDWLIERDGHSLDNMLDLAKPEVAEWVESEAVRIVEEYGIDLLRLDYNASPGEGGYNLRDGWAENTIWRHYEAMYGIWERLRARFPRLILENCAGGGGRTDLGMVSRCHFTWFSDYCLAPRALRMQSGMMMALPPEMLARATGVVMDAHLGGDLDMQLRMNMLLGNPCLSGMWPTREDVNPIVLDKTREAVGFFKEHVRPMLATSRVFHHTPEVAGDQPEGWCVLEFAAADGAKSIVGAFRLAGQAEAERVVRLRGLPRAGDYSVEFLSTHESVRVSGRELAEGGLRVTLPHPMTSELIVVRR